jgi:hypothetical protein
MVSSAEPLQEGGVKNEGRRQEQNRRERAGGLDRVNSGIRRGPTPESSLFDSTLTIIGSLR